VNQPTIGRSEVLHSLLSQPWFCRSY